MKVEIWSDYVCPFCYIGKKKLELALEQFAHKDKIEILYKSFELDPNADSDTEMDTYTMLSQKYGMSVQQAKQNSSNIAEQAAEVGLTFNFDGTVMTNTFDAHRLMQFAAKQGKNHQMANLLFQSYFTNNVNIGKRDSLIAIAGQLDLDEDETAAMLASDQFSAEVRAEEEEASRLGVRGVPFFVIDRKYAVSGAQSPEVFLNALKQAWDEKYPALVQVSDDQGGMCTDGVCEPKQQ